MMYTFNVVRDFRNEDEQILNKRAAQFCERHNLAMRDGWQELDADLQFGDKKRLLILWRRIMNRALGEKVGINIAIAYGKIGYYFG